jgi:hypothetical protein
MKRSRFTFMQLMLIPEFQSIVNNEREQLAAQKVGAYAATEAGQGRKIFLIFGSAHDFSLRGDDNLSFKVHVFEDGCAENMAKLK